MALRRPVVSFAYDYDHYQTIERGLFYELDDVLPGPVCRDFQQLATALDGILETPTPEEMTEYDIRARIFFDYEDDNNARRVVERVKRLYVGGGE
jgi:CDP-glycerol glycerophosphotransferase (TagB/SpsB family)